MGHALSFIQFYFLCVLSCELNPEVLHSLERMFVKTSRSIKYAKPPLGKTDRLQESTRP